MLLPFQMDDKSGSENRAKIVIQHSILIISKYILIAAVFRLDLINIWVQSLKKRKHGIDTPPPITTATK